MFYAWNLGLFFGHLSWPRKVGILNSSWYKVIGSIFPWREFESQFLEVQSMLRHQTHSHPCLSSGPRDWTNLGYERVGVMIISWEVGGFITIVHFPPNLYLLFQWPTMICIMAWWVLWKAYLRLWLILFGSGPSIGFGGILVTRLAFKSFGRSWDNGSGRRVNHLASP